MNNLLALCAVGAEKIVGNEIKLLGYELDSSQNLPGRVAFFGDDGAFFRANLCLRTADRVYLRLGKFRAEDFDALFEGAKSISWQDFLNRDSKIAVDKVRTYKSKLSSEHAVQSVVQKAIYTKLGEIWKIQTLPENGAQADVRVYIDSDEVQILLDLSGEPLHKRGYRTDGGTAPLRETAAAALLQFMLWKRKIPLHDPFCGSGTIAIEASLFAYNAAPGFGRHFALESLPIFDSEKAAEIRRSEAAKIRTDVECRITGTDIDSQAVSRSRKNAEHALVSVGRALKEIGIDAHLARPDFDRADFRELSAPYKDGMILTNPPYGERLGDEAAAAEIYRDMANLFDEFPHWKIGAITSVATFQACIGRYAHFKKPIKAGKLDTTLYIFDGTEKPKKQKFSQNQKSGKSGNFERERTEKTDFRKEKAKNQNRKKESGIPEDEF